MQYQCCSIELNYSEVFRSCQGMVNKKLSDNVKREKLHDRTCGEGNS